MNFPQTASCSNLFSDKNIRNNVKGIKISSLIKSLIVLLYVIKSKTINYLLTFWAELLLDAGELLGDEHQQ